MDCCLSHGTALRYDYRSGFDLCDECETEREREERIIPAAEQVDFSRWLAAGPYWDNYRGMVERAERIIRLQTGRGMSPRAATIVVDAAMYGIGCTEGEVREKIEREKEKR